jgi:hypothetical protein
MDHPSHKENQITNILNNFRSGPVVSECEGDYVYEARRHTLLWQLPVVDSSNKTGSMEFTVATGHASQFFPVQVSFHSNQAFARLSVSNDSKEWMGKSNDLIAFCTI